MIKFIKSLWKSFKEEREAKKRCIKPCGISHSIVPEMFKNIQWDEHLYPNKTYV